MGTLDTIVKKVIQRKSGFSRDLHQVSDTEIRKVAPIVMDEDNSEDTSIAESTNSTSVDLSK